MHSVIAAQAQPTARSWFILRFPDLRSRKGIPYSRMHIDRLEKAGQFPKRIEIGTNSVGWIEDEVDAWIAGKAAARDRSPEPEPAQAA